MVHDLLITEDWDTVDHNTIANSNLTCVHVGPDSLQPACGAWCFCVIGTQHRQWFFDVPTHTERLMYESTYTQPQSLTLHTSQTGYTLSTLLHAITFY